MKNNEDFDVTNLFRKRVNNIMQDMHDEQQIKLIKPGPQMYQKLQQRLDKSRDRYSSRMKLMQN